MAIATIAPCRTYGKERAIFEHNVSRMICSPCANGETVMAEEMPVEVGVGIGTACAAAFFGTIDAFWLRSYGWDTSHIDQTQFGWMTFFAALFALFLVVSLGIFTWMASLKIVPLLGYASKVFLGIWGIAITLAVAAMAYMMFFVHKV